MQSLIAASVGLWRQQKLHNTLSNVTGLLISSFPSLADHRTASCKSGGKKSFRNMQANLFMSFRFSGEIYRIVFLIIHSSSKGRRRKSGETEFHNKLWSAALASNPWQNDILFSMFYWPGLFFINIWLVVFCLLLNGILNNFFRLRCKMQRARAGIVDKTAPGSLLGCVQGLGWRIVLVLADLVFDPSTWLLKIKIHFS